MSFLKAVAARAVLAVTGVSYVNPVKFAVHSVLIEFAIGHSAGHTAVDFMSHSVNLLAIIMPVRQNIIRKR